MGIIRLTLIATALALVLGLFFGYQLGIKKRDKLLIELQNSHLEVYQKERKKTNEYKAIAEKNYQDYLAASNREPDVIERRVYIKADCPALPTNTGGSVGDAAEYTKAELHPETVRRVAAVTDQATADVLKCQAQLTSLQEKITLFNKGK